MRELSRISLQTFSKKIQKNDHSISNESSQTENGNMEQADYWSQESVEYLFDNKIWLPGFVRLEVLIVR